MPSVHDVTIIIPSYCPTEQHIQWLKEAILSAQAQKCKVIVVDDGSPLQGDVHDTLSEILGQGDDVAVLEHHRGVSTARNVAASMVRSALLYPLDGDDLLVPDAVNQLLSVWRGIPVYSDLEKFNAEKSVHYPLLDFSCDLMYEKIGVASVNVLHTVEQHRSIGGWDVDLDFYEDGEYNARLMLCYKAMRFPKPLVRYRQHEYQRTKTYRTQHSKYTKIVFDKIRRYNMAGCGGGCGKKKNITQTGAQAMSKQMSRQTAAATLPGEDSAGRVLAQYVGGKGRGAHYYRGRHSKYPYKVKYGDYIHVDPKDAIEPHESVGINTSLLVKIAAEEAKVEKKTVEKKTEGKQERKPRVDMEKSPVLSTEVAGDEDELIPIQTMAQNDVLRALDDIDPEDAEELLDIEQDTRNRKKVVSKLVKIIKSVEEPEE